MGPIFYNVFIPDDDAEKQENAIRIIKEQMQQRSWADPSSPIKYTLIGSSDFKDDLCQPCERDNYLKQEDEVATLQALYEYCKSQGTPECLCVQHKQASFKF